MDARILVIEDNEQDQKIVKRYLGKAGFNNVVFADSGEKGVELCKSERPFLVVTDTNLPGINGFEACRQIKEFDANAIKVIVVTGAVDAIDAEKARQMGADDYCVKTADCAPLIDAVKNIVNTSGV